MALMLHCIAVYSMTDDLSSNRGRGREPTVQPRCQCMHAFIQYSNYLRQLHTQLRYQHTISVLPVTATY
jgi:hypothetical protein